MNPTTTPSPVALVDWLSMGMSFLAVLAIVALIYFFGKRFAARGLRRPERNMTIVETMAIDSRQRIVLMRVREREVMVGITQHGMAALAEWPIEPTTAASSDANVKTLKAVPTQKSAAAATPARKGFGELFRAANGRNVSVRV
jgi:flagellar biogenesis protein FliO